MSEFHLEEHVEFSVNKVDVAPRPFPSCRRGHQTWLPACEANAMPWNPISCTLTQKVMKTKEIMHTDPTLPSLTTK